MQTLETSATFLHCPECRLALMSGPGKATRPGCPHCLESAGKAVAMYPSPLNGAEMRVRLERVRPLHGLRDARASMLAFGGRVAGKLSHARPATRPAAG